MITPKEATEAAIKFYGETMGIIVTNITLEEIELKGEYWYVTLGFPKSSLLSYDVKDYKVFKVDAKNSKVESMTMKK